MNLDKVVRSNCFGIILLTGMVIFIGVNMGCKISEKTFDPKDNGTFEVFIMNSDGTKQKRGFFDDVPHFEIQNSELLISPENKVVPGF